jgi:hypothetical protein
MKDRDTRNYLFLDVNLLQENSGVADIYPKTAWKRSALEGFMKEPKVNPMTVF